jgi:hypothetical protein
MNYSKKGLEKRKQDREGLSEFFMECVNEIKTKQLHCEECGAKLKGDVSEVAHILPKSSFRSIQTNKLNWIPLCGMYSEKQCHTNFDNWPVKKIKNMFIYPKIMLIFAELEPLIKEKIHYKIYDKYEQS